MSRAIESPVIYHSVPRGPAPLARLPFAVTEPSPTRHTAAGIALNLLLLALIAYGYRQSEEWRWAWALVAIPITIVTLTYVWHLLKRQP
jgi:hypothetical protein